MVVYLTAFLIKKYLFVAYKQSVWQALNRENLEVFVFLLPIFSPFALVYVSQVVLQLLIISCCQLVDYCFW